MSGADILYFANTLNHRIRNVDFSTDLMSTVDEMHRRGTWHLTNEAEYNDTGKLATHVHLNEP